MPNLPQSCTLLLLCLPHHHIYFFTVDLVPIAYVIYNLNSQIVNVDWLHNLKTSCFIHAHVIL